MSDFYQTGLVATLHRLGRANGHKIEAELQVFGKQRPIALVLPALYSEFESGALHRIIQELTKPSYLSQIILTLGGADAGQFRQAKDYPGKLPQQV
jgi:glucosyl-3-phosphoglycerate synthase